LATIALKKRILQSELVDLRGSGAYDHIKELLAQDFIERKRQSDGRSFWLTLSEKFHRTFAIEAEALRPPRSRAKPAGSAAQPDLASSQDPPPDVAAPSPTGDDDWEQAA
jgi:segregation and condensation protein B